MKRSALILLLIIAVSSHLSAQLLYKISGNSSHAPSYILATEKYIDFTYADSIPGCFKAFGRCQTVLTEFAIPDHEMLAAMRQMDFKPSYMYSVVRDSIMAHRLGYDPTRSMETFFQLVAADKGMPVYGLDNIGETLYMLFQRNPEEYQQKMLTDLMAYPEYDVDLERDLLTCYRLGHLTDMAYRITGPDNKATFGYADYQTYAKRNAVWAKKMKPYLTTGKCFITLNAIYLGGEKGLLAALRAEGYRVTPVRK